MNTDMLSVIVSSHDSYRTISIDHDFDISCSCRAFGMKSRCKHNDALLLVIENKMKLLSLSHRPVWCTSTNGDHDEWQCIPFPMLLVMMMSS